MDQLFPKQIYFFVIRGETSMRTRAENCFLYSIHTIGYDSGAYLRGYCVEGGRKKESVYLLLYVIPLFNRRRIDVFAPPLFPCDWHSE